MIFDVLTLNVDLLYNKIDGDYDFWIKGLYIVVIYIWLPPVSYVVF